ncbi:flavin reductase family protein [Brevibacillus humidisoli]|uniref:flavin reductase family protein n=1 Tax=Brevibacillus humidisoli TaxID=2895522 RepID=UPI001E3CBF41|nr:flavin reductase family protein [Brevibacillus humidisoli]UFJ39281.1 flavin reductase family protein [Brevibacillus humidisoli]
MPDQVEQCKASRTIHPSILYYGTPVIMLSTANEDGTTNLSPLSSSWALGSCIVLGIGLGGKAIENLQHRPECVINVPHPGLWRAVESLAPLTGKSPVPEAKRQNGFRYEKDKFTAAGLLPVPSVDVLPDRVSDCPLQMEAKVMNIRVPEHNAFFAIVEAEVVHVHAHEDIMLNERHINPQAWSPLIYNFRHYFGLGEELGKSYRAET